MKNLPATIFILAFVIVGRPQPPAQPPSIEERLKKTNEIMQKRGATNNNTKNFY
jgi:hypothetical protein